jgi:hypothetical protein
MNTLLALIAVVTIQVYDISEPVQSVTAEADQTPVVMSASGEEWIGICPSMPTQAVAYMTDLAGNIGMALWSINDTPTPTSTPTPATGFISPASGTVFPSGSGVLMEHVPVIPPNDGFLLDRWVEAEGKYRYYRSTPSINVNGVATGQFENLPENMYRVFYLSYQPGLNRSRRYFSVGEVPTPTETERSTPTWTSTFTQPPTPTKAATVSPSISSTPSSTASPTPSPTHSPTKSETVTPSPQVSQQTSTPTKSPIYATPTPEILILQIEGELRVRVMR